jgi:transcriptional regulator of acetoin/glycerol metabolism
VSGVAERLLAMNLAHPMEAIEVALLSRAMISANGNITAASRILGIHRKAVERLVTKHKVKRNGKPRRQRPPAAKRGRARQLKKRR